MTYSTPDVDKTKFKNISGTNSKKYKFKISTGN